MSVALLEALAAHAPLAIAVSGGVDSMTLAHAARRAGVEAQIVHALSPAVPQEASERVRCHAKRNGWRLTLIDAGELSDPRYTQNPVNRCYFCKTNLYARIRAHTQATIASGTNVDDLGDYRPGLHAAAEHRVVHPYVEAAMTKADVYALAASFGLSDIAALPAQPCLASRIETGLVVDPGTLAFIERAESVLRAVLPGAVDVRCRVTRGGVVGEARPLPPDTRDAEDALAALCADAARPFAGMRPYRRGAAFLLDRRP